MARGNAVSGLRVSHQQLLMQILKTTYHSQWLLVRECRAGSKRLQELPIGV